MWEHKKLGIGSQRLEQHYQMTIFFCKSELLLHVFWRHIDAVGGFAASQLQSSPGYCLCVSMVLFWLPKHACRWIGYARCE